MTFPLRLQYLLHGEWLHRYSSSLMPMSCPTMADIETKAHINYAVWVAIDITSVN